MRLFTAIDLSDEVRANVDFLQRQLKATARIQWSPASNLHITTKFIGEWREDRLEDLKTVLTMIPPAGSIDIAIRRLGWFPNPQSPRVLFAGVQAPQSLRKLAREIDAVLSVLGVPTEERPYSPHITLARMKTPQPMAAPMLAVANLEALEFGAFTATRYHLYLSERTSAGSIYTKLSDFSLIP